MHEDLLDIPVHFNRQESWGGDNMGGNNMPRPPQNPSPAKEGILVARACFALFVLVGVFVLSGVVYDLGSERNSVRRGEKGSSGYTTSAIDDHTRLASSSEVERESTLKVHRTDSRSSIENGNDEKEEPTSEFFFSKLGIHFTHPGDMSNDAVSVCPEASQSSINSVTLAGNRPVGTYLCEYFQKAPRTTRGCSLECQLPNRNGGKPFTCDILHKAEPSELYTSDIVVNHFGPVPKKKGGKPFITMFYQGESKAADGKRALKSYLAQYDRVISFSRDFKHKFTWSHRHVDDFMLVRKGDRAATSALLGGSVSDWRQRKDAVAVFVSRCKKGGRDLVIKSLAAHYTVHSFGKCARTHRLAELHPDCASIGKGRYPEKSCVFKKYKYILALDNTRELDYVTEKVYHALLAGAVPIYDGAPNVDELLPGGTESVIMMQDFRKDKSRLPALGNADTNNHDVDFEALAAHLKSVDSNQTLQDGYLRWRTKPSAWSDEFLRNVQQPEPTCDVCADALEMKRCAAYQKQSTL